MTDPRVGDAIATIREAAKDMGQSDQFKVVFEEYPGLSEAEIDDWQSVIREELPDPKYRIPEELRRFYGECGGLLLQWQYRGLGKTVLGSANIVGLVELYQTDEEADRPMSAIYDEDRKFDIVSENEYVAIAFEKASGDRNQLLWVDQESGRRDKLKLDPTEYLKALAEYRAAYGWQSLFVADKAPDPAFAAALRTDVDRLFGLLSRKVHDDRRPG
jgi:hypothetical protein